MVKGVAKSLFAVLAVLSTSVTVRAGTLKVPSAPFPTIQAAVDAAAEGDTIVVSPKPSTLDGQSVPQGLWFHPYQEEVVVQTKGIKLVGKAAVIDGQHGHSCIRILADDVSITGFRLVNGVFGLRAGESGNVSGLVVKNVTVQGCENGGMDLHVEGALVTKNTVVGCFGPGLSCFSADPTILTTVSSNTVSGCSAGGIFAGGPLILVSHNECRGNGGDGLSVTIGVTGAGSRIEKNTCELNGQAGLHAVNAGGTLTIKSNKLLDNGTDGLLGEGTSLEIVSNQALHNVVSGLDVLMGEDADPGQDIDTHLSKNRCERNGACGLIAASEGELVLVDDNDAKDNRGAGLCGEGLSVQIKSNAAGSNGGAGISVDGAGLHVESNQCVSNSGHGILVAGDGCTIFDNLARLNAHDGIHVTGKDHSVLSNTCTDNVGDGIDVQTDLDNDPDPDCFTVNDNDAMNNGGEGIENSADDTTMENNDAEENTGPDIAGGGDNGGGNVIEPGDTFNHLNKFGGLAGAGVSSQPDQDDS